MRSNRPTVADLLAMKGKKQLSKIRVFTMEEVEAAARAGVEILSVTPELIFNPAFRDAAPDCFAIPGSVNSFFALKEDVMRDAFRFIRAGADAVYCAASLDTIRALADEHVPVCGHSGLIPHHSTWTGGYRAVGKTAETAMFVWNQVKALEKAGAFAAEIEVVPVEVASAISARTSLFMISMGAGCRLRCAVSLFRRHTGVQSRPLPASLQGVPQLCSRIRPTAGRARSGLWRVRRRCPLRRVSRSQSMSSASRRTS